MSKNKKIVLLCVSILFILIAAVLFIRDPVKQPASEPPKQTQVETPTPAPTTDPIRSDSHETVEKIIDQASKAVADQAPGLWEKVVSTWYWFMGFDTKYALILLAVCLILCAIIFGNNKNKKSS